MRRMRLKRKIKMFNKPINVIVFIIIIFIIAFFLLLKVVNLKVNPVLFEYAELESRKLASIIINNAVAKNVTENIDIDELFIITRDSNNEIKTIDFNPLTVNKILTKVTNSVQINLKYIEQGKVELLTLTTDELIDYDIDKLKKGIIYEIPTGVIFNNSFLSNLGPKLPVKLCLAGDIISHINTKVTNYGINNALIEVGVVLELKEQVILPFMSERIKIECEIPVAIKLIQGTVPNYYFNGLDKNSPSVTLPIS